MKSEQADAHGVLTAKRDIPPLHDGERAMWHLELGYEPGAQYAPESILPALFQSSVDYDDDDDGDWDEDDGLGCTWCGGEGWAEVDDPLWDVCDEFGYGDCPACNGTGERRHQWVF